MLRYIFRKKIFLRILQGIITIIRIENFWKNFTCNFTSGNANFVSTNEFGYGSGKLPEIPLCAADDGADIPRAIRSDENPSIRTKSFPKCRVFEGERSLS